MIQSEIVYISYFVILISILLRVNEVKSYDRYRGQCPYGEEYRTVTSCDGSIKTEKRMYADLSKINCPCTCTVTALFVGRITVRAWRVKTECNNRVTVNNTVTFNCKDGGSHTFDVSINDTVLFWADHQHGYTKGRFKPCLGIENKDEGDGKLSIKCGGQPRQDLSIKTTRPPASRLIQMSSTASSKESTVAVNNRKDAYLKQKDVNTGNVDLKSLSKKPTTADVENDLKKDPFFLTTHVSNASTPDLNSSSEILMATYLQEKKNVYSTTGYLLNTSTADFKSSSEESRAADPENISILASIAAGGIVLAIALIVCIIILLNRVREERHGGLVLKSAIVHTNRTFENNSGLPNNPLNNISQHVDEAGNSSAQDQQLRLPQKASKINHKIISHYDVPPINKPVDQGVYSLAKNVFPNKNDELCPDMISEDVYAQVFKQNNSNPLAPIQAQNHDDDGLIIMEVEIDTTAIKQRNSMDNIECKTGSVMPK